jgi:hypothetical protein
MADAPNHATAGKSSGLGSRRSGAAARRYHSQRSHPRPPVHRRLVSRVSRLPKRGAGARLEQAEPPDRSWSPYLAFFLETSQVCSVGCPPIISADPCSDRSRPDRRCATSFVLIVTECGHGKRIPVSAIPKRSVTGLDLLLDLPRALMDVVWMPALAYPVVDRWSTWWCYRL